MDGEKTPRKAKETLRGEFKYETTTLLHKELLTIEDVETLLHGLNLTAREVVNHTVGLVGHHLSNAIVNILGNEAHIELVEPAIILELEARVSCLTCE